jgi:hypothetical protein
LAVIQANPAVFTALAANPTSPTLQAQAVAAAGGGAKGLSILTTIAANQAAIQGVIAVAAQLQTLAPFTSQLTTIAPYASELTTIAPYKAQLTALAQVPPAVSSFAAAHGTAVTHAAAKTGSQWKTWYWICFGGVVFFLFTVPIMRGRWSPKAAKADEEAHEDMVQTELAKLAQGTA